MMKYIVRTLLQITGGFQSINELLENVGAQIAMKVWHQWQLKK